MLGCFPSSDLSNQRELVLVDVRVKKAKSQLLLRRGVRISRNSLSIILALTPLDFGERSEREGCS